MRKTANTQEYIHGRCARAQLQGLSPHCLLKDKSMTIELLTVGYHFNKLKLFSFKKKKKRKTQRREKKHTKRLKVLNYDKLWVIFIVLSIHLALCSNVYSFLLCKGPNPVSLVCLEFVGFTPQHGMSTLGSDTLPNRPARREARWASNLKSLEKDRAFPVLTSRWATFKADIKASRN